MGDVFDPTKGKFVSARVGDAREVAPLPWLQSSRHPIRAEKLSDIGDVTLFALVNELRRAAGDPEWRRGGPGRRDLENEFKRLKGKL